LDRLLDFVREFSDEPKHVREATFLANTLRRIDRFEKERNLSFEEAEKQRQTMIRKLLELIDEVEVHPQLAVAG
jgi:hemerythrin-like domain-containing protein